MKRVRLTKKRLQALDAALSLDDVLYEKFRRLQKDLQHEYRRLYRAKQVVSVAQRRNDRLHELCIEAIQVSPEGTRIICR